MKHTIAYSFILQPGNVLQRQRLPARECRADAEVELDARGHRLGLQLVDVAGPQGRLDDVRALDVGKPRALDLEPRVRLQRDFAHLGADELALAVAVGPDEQAARADGQPRDVALDVLLVLARM